MAKVCNGCSACTELKEIPLISAECEAVRQHNTIKLLIIGWIITVLILFGSNLAWIIYNAQYETVVETYEVDLEQTAENGDNTCIINGGECPYGETESQD